MKKEEKKLIKASISIKQAVAGKKTDCRLTVNIGQGGMSKGGILKVLFRAISDAGIPQFTDPDDRNYVYVKSSKIPDLFKLISSTDLPIKIHERPWWNGFLAKAEKTISPNETVMFIFSNWIMQTFKEDEFRIQLFVDPLNTGKFVSVADSPKFKVIPDKPSKLELISPTTISRLKKFDSLLRLTDKWGNTINHPIKKIKADPSDSAVKILKIRNFGDGRIILTSESDSKKPFYFYASWRKKIWKSNYTDTLSNRGLHHYWSDLHWQSEAFKGVKELKKGFDFARYDAFLDVTSHQGNDFQISDKFWMDINRLSALFSEEGKHIAMPGFEWSGNTSVGGDHNVIFEKADIPILRSSNSLIGKTKFNKFNSPEIKKLFRKLKKVKAIVIAHAGGRKADLVDHDRTLQRLVEVYSCWGFSEELFFESLKRGYKLGIVANSDGHMLRPGAEYPGNSPLFKVRGGLTCILAENLTAKSIFKALYLRHCYATSGRRTLLRYSINAGKKELIMGDEGKFKRETEFEVKVTMHASGKLISLILFDGLRKVKEFVEERQTKNYIELRNFKLANLEVGSHAFYLKAVEEDNIVWSSPIFIDIK